MLAFIFATVLFGSVFQNCARTNFKSITDGRIASLSTCLPSEEPDKSKSENCPAGSTGTGVTSTRAVACVDNVWTPGSWSNPDYSTCSCTGGKTVNSANGKCECPAGKAEDGSGTCVLSTCSAETRPSSTDTMSCPSGTGTATRSRTVTCQSGVWSTDTWTIWSYTNCNCPITGQYVNAQTGICECELGKVLVGGTCQTSSTCDNTKRPNSTETKSCPQGSNGSYAQTRNVTCQESTKQWITGDWTSNYSSCSCPQSGQVFNASKNPACECPAGSSLVGNSCQVGGGTCPANTKPTESQTKSCPAPAIGIVTSNRTVKCQNGNWIAPEFPAPDYSSCTCPNIGQVVDPIKGTCSCPASKPNLVYGVCTPNVCKGGTHDETSPQNNSGRVSKCHYVWPNITHNPANANKIYSYIGTLNGVDDIRAKISGTCSASGEWTNVQIDCPMPLETCDPFIANYIPCDRRIRATLYLGRNDWDNFDEYVNEYHFVWNKDKNMNEKVVDGPDGDIYFSEIWVPTRSAINGFPGICKQTEFFALDVKTKIQPSLTMPEDTYQFAVLSDDGAILSYIPNGSTTETVLVNQDSIHKTRYGCANAPVYLVKGKKLPFRIKYFQAHGPKLALVLLYRPWNLSGNNSPVQCGAETNEFFGVDAQNFRSSHTFPGTAYENLLKQGWKPVPIDSYSSPDLP